MFDSKYFEWNQKRVKGIIDFYGYKFFYFKRLLDLGCGYGDISGALYRLGADVTAIDARQEHLKVVTKKFTGIKVVQANLDGQWPYTGQKFDLILDLGLLCHLAAYDTHLRAICASTTHLVLETAVCDSDDSNKCIAMPENKGIYDLSYNGQGCRPSAATIERILQECGMNFKRMDSAKFNTGDYQYDWYPQNDGSTDISKRRIWFCVKGDSPIQFANPQSQLAVPPIIPSAEIAATPIQNSGIPVITAGNSKPVTIISRMAAERAKHIPVANTVINTAPVAPSNPSSSMVYTSGDKKFVIVIPSYNNEKWCEKNMQSSLDQNYTNYRIIFTDDCSSDGTFDKVNKVVVNSGKAGKVTLIKNANRIGALANLYNMIHSCNDDEIILTLDGDDWLAHPNVLNKLNQVYSGEDVWMTYGQYQNSNDGGRGIAQQYPHNIIEHNVFRQHVWCASHLRTFYTWLFKKIRKEDLLHTDGNFLPMTWDFAMMFPMLEMSGQHSRFISDILYIYNLDNPINDHKVNVRLQQDLDRKLRSMPKYGRVDKPAPRKPKVGLLLIATGKYHRFIQGMLSSADNYFLNGLADVTYYIFSDAQVTAQSKYKIVHIPTDHRPFPYASMDRFKHFTNNASVFNQEDYLYYIDVDCLFVDKVNAEIFGNLVGVRHCGFVNKLGPYEANTRSSLFVDINSYPKKYKYYFGGGFSGGKRDSYLALAKWCSEKIEQDLASGIMPIWHDETALNRYFLDNEPSVVLSPAYHYPQSGIERYRQFWAPDNWQPKIMLLDKNHTEVRK